MNRPNGCERGSVSILTAGILVLACVLCLVAVDLMRALQARAQAQTAADAAALAAAQELAVPTGHDPSSLAADYASRNGATMASCKCAAGSSEAIVTVRVGVTFVFLGPARTVTGAARAVVDATYGGGVVAVPP